jgi:ribonuclease BN (tRNA processing enzyme)
MSAAHLTRRSVLGLLGWTAFGMSSRAMAQARASAKVTLLGTAGGPPPHLERSQPASLLEVGGKTYLIDAGENVAQQLLRAGGAPQKVNAVFLTHLHWDHTLGLDYLLATGWMMGRREEMPIWGPPGTVELVARATREVQLGEAIFRTHAENRPNLAGLYRAREIKRDSVDVLFEDGNVSVSAVANTHFARIRSPRHRYGEDKCYSYRFDTPHGAVVFTGDTGPSDAVARLAKGASVLVAEIVDLDSIRVSLRQAGAASSALDTLMQHMEHQHLTAMELGKLATAANVGKLVLSHYVVGRGFDPESFVSQIKPYFKGEVVVGKDLSTVSLT